ncbi:hypothetical protein G6K93_07425 [Agrobacterium rhizogenes]|nr:hypothetical protein [Rhizobium rhizogenes]
MTKIPNEPIAHLVWLQGRRAADDVEDYYEVARPGDKSVDGSDPFPVYAALGVGTVAQEPVFLMCEACGSLLGDSRECDCSKIGAETQRIVGLYAAPQPAAVGESVIVKTICQHCERVTVVPKNVIEAAKYAALTAAVQEPVAVKADLGSGTVAIDILHRIINQRVFMVQEFGDGRPRIVMTFDEENASWEFVSALVDARKFVDAAVAVPEVATKVLEWSANESRSSLGDLYSVSRLSEIVHVTYKNGTAFPGWKPTLDEAKAAAQADYEQRIRSALSTSQSDPAPEIAALRAENERLRKAITEVRAEFYTDYVGEKLTGVSYGSTALSRVVGLLDAALTPEQGEAK